MPVYEYRCKDCGKTHEIEHGFHDERPSQCPSCGGQLVRVFHPVGVHFKGSGFHKNDYSSSGLRKERTGAAAGSDAAKGDGKVTDSKPADSAAGLAKTEAKSGDSKPAGKSGDSTPSSRPPKP